MQSLQTTLGFNEGDNNSSQIGKNKSAEKYLQKTPGYLHQNQSISTTIPHFGEVVFGIYNTYYTVNGRLVPTNKFGTRDTSR